MHDIRIPKSGMSTVEVDITDLFIALGQHVELGDSIAEIDTEKVTMTLESDATGTVTEILVAIGDSREVGDVICRLSTG